MKLVVGLGNPGSRYKNTPHNVGFWALDKLAQDKKWKKSKKGQTLYTWLNDNIELLKPQTLMNKSGQSVAYAIKKHNLDPACVIVVHDDVDLLLGRVKVSKNKGDAGHKGVRSIIENLGTKEFTRVRIGVGGNEYSDLSKFVLKRMSPDHRDIIEEAWPQISEALDNELSTDV